MKAGDAALVYHTGDEKARGGHWPRSTRAAYADPEGGATRGCVVVDLGRGRLAQPVTLAEIKALAAFADSPLVRQGRPVGGAAARRRSGRRCDARGEGCERSRRSCVSGRWSSDPPRRECSPARIDRGCSWSAPGRCAATSSP